MEFSLARAMQIACIESEEELTRIHAVENRCGYCIPNWNIQAILGLRPIRELLNIPDDDSSQSKHANRIREEIKRIDLFSHVSGDGSVAAVNGDTSHSFDWAVFNNKSKIVWEYSGGRKRMESVFEGA